uniref:Uncharacterized protein n=1 Tax=uncultured prokaryote TaxID=198431 RepID=A0A0H5Q440_9ZZZZ|nr:hypothetical protein [uncultured prokaryote]
MRQSKKFRTHRFEYVGCEATDDVLKVWVQFQALQGPAGWVDQGRREPVMVPLTRLALPDVTDSLDRAVRRVLAQKWAVAAEDPLF